MNRLKRFSILTISLLGLSLVNCIATKSAVKQDEIISAGCGDSLEYFAVDTNDFWINTLYYYKKAFLANHSDSSFFGVRIFWLPSFEKELLVEWQEDDSKSGKLFIYYPNSRRIAQDIYDSTHIIDSVKAIIRFGDSVGYQEFSRDLPVKRYNPGIRIVKTRIVDTIFENSFQDSMISMGIDTMKCVRKKECYGLDGTTAIVEVYKDTIINQFHFWVDDYIDKRYVWISEIMQSLYP